LANGLDSIFFTQLVGAPLYFYNKDWYYAYMAMTKRYFAIVTSCMTHIWGPTTIRISGDATVMKQIEATPDGGVQFNFPERIILIANHQVNNQLGFGLP
jgi:1-acyl-sn-glycerol-3-phosphate acyltransferase